MPDSEEHEALRRALDQLATTPLPAPRHTDADIVTYSRRTLVRHRAEVGVLFIVLGAVAWWLARLRQARRGRPLPDRTT
ncbi:MAG TPA: hypothetical protein VHF06_38465 [Pseudonocardiaceae bacterium]|nr:hypothetical protein [Pseudonocardiaceae bacterium]